ncbi:uncharacterized protein LOC101001412 [Papio anubis]|uniref:uncharacterized protein LOC101001412 n=1 Tax=Papio anubis TaxID=9555 RepID=UPI0012AE0DB6|nr:uncharacterized protein LOC101001412 [Papio anubis]
MKSKTVPTGGLWLLEPQGPAVLAPPPLSLPAGRLPLSASSFPILREKPSSQSRCSQSPRPSRPCAGPPPAVAASTTSVPLNRFLLHVNTYYRSQIFRSRNFTQGAILKEPHSKSLIHIWVCLEQQDCSL